MRQLPSSTDRQMLFTLRAAQYPTFVYTGLAHFLTSRPAQRVYALIGVATHLP